MRVWAIDDGLQRVSVPYSSGQSLQCDAVLIGGAPFLFQSPIRRGSRCNAGVVEPESADKQVSVPYSSGQSLQLARGHQPACRSIFADEVSVPYSSGQSLQSRPLRISRAGSHSFSPLFVGAGVAMLRYDQQYYGAQLFQSPICRGRRCNITDPCIYMVPSLFQSPICRGRRCNWATRAPGLYRPGVSVPYLSGQALQSASGGSWSTRTPSFSPLFVGAGVAIAVPTHVRQHRFGFSPLFVGAGVAMLRQRKHGLPAVWFQSPICRGRRCNHRLTTHTSVATSWFQSPICRGRRCNGTKRG